MSRNASGAYTLPAANPVVSGTTISSTWANNTLNDLATEVTSSLDRQGRGAMLAPLQSSSGTVSAPGVTFSAETNSGLYRAGSHDIRLAVNGADVLKSTTTGVNVTGTTTSSGALTVSAGGATVAGATAVTGGDVTIDSGKNYKYASTVSHITHIAGSEFVATNGTTATYDLNLGIKNGTTGLSDVMAQFRLPPGAIITAIDACITNSDSGSKTYNVTVATKTKSSTQYNAATYITTGSGSGVNISAPAATNWYSVAIVGGVASIDDGSADGINYILVVLPATTSAGQSILNAIRLTYTMTSVKPAV